MSPPRPGITFSQNGVEFAVYSSSASLLELCLFSDDGNREQHRLPMTAGPDGIWRISVDGAQAGLRYGYRAHGGYEPDRGLWHDPSKLLVDPYAVELDRPFTYEPIISKFGAETAQIVPRAILRDPIPVAPRPPVFSPGGLVYEVNVRALTRLHPAVPEDERGTVRALAHPAILAHLKAIGATAVELMPITAWIDERHLPPLGLKNSWGYNPVALMALDPRLCPGGIAELTTTVTALHAHGIATILDLVFNHTGESDQMGPTISMRGLDSLTYYSAPPGHPGLLINDTGCGNTLACHNEIVMQLVLDSLRHFVRYCGVDGFRFDLAPIMGRSPDGFRADAPLLRSMLADPVLRDRILIAEPWDVGPGGYQLGNFPPPFLEWNDRARDDLRMFWRGDRRKIGDLATLLAGSSSIFSRNSAKATRSVNFAAAHDGFSLMDLVSHEHKHNELNGEDNRDGHNENLSWNNGVEGASSDPAIVGRRRRDVMALLSTLFVSSGTVMLMAGDEFGRTQHGNNNAYAQDNALTWLDWTHADQEILQHVIALADLRNRFDTFSKLEFFTEKDVEWLTLSGEPMQVRDWEDPENGTMVMVLKSLDRQTGEKVRLAIAFNRTYEDRPLSLPGQSAWQCLVGQAVTVAQRSVSILMVQDNIAI